MFTPGADDVFAEINEQAVVKASGQFWGQMLSMEVEAFPSSEAGGMSARHMMGSVALLGAWKGRIEIRMAIGLAFEATAAMLMQPLETVMEADALDATKEIANMIAGVIKSSLPRPCTMTVPESGIEAESFIRGTEGEDCIHVSFRHASGEFLVRVWEQECVAGRIG